LANKAHSFASKFYIKNVNLLKFLIQNILAYMHTLSVESGTRNKKNIEIIYHTCRAHISPYSCVMINLSITYPSSDKKIYKNFFFIVFNSSIFYFTSVIWNILSCVHEISLYLTNYINFVNLIWISSTEWATDRWNFFRKKNISMEIYQNIFVWIVQSILMWFFFFNGEEKCFLFGILNVGWIDWKDFEDLKYSWS